MALSPAVLKQQAAALELKKQPEKALALYQQLLTDHGGTTEVDVALRNRVGDLHLRVGQIDDAIPLFEKSADEYALSGFLNNAIALCNKILRQRPGHVPTLRRLARFSAEKGMVVDAQRHYLSVAEALEKLGQHGEALRALSEFAELSPDDVHVRSVVVEQLLRAGRKPDALPHLTVLHRLHALAGRTDEAEGVAQVAREMDPHWAPEAISEFARKRNDPSLVFIDSDDDFGALEIAPMPGSDRAQPPGMLEGLELTTPSVPDVDRTAVGATLDGFEATSFGDAVGVPKGREPAPELEAAPTDFDAPEELIAAPVMDAAPVIDVVEADSMPGSDIVVEQSGTDELAPLSRPEIPGGGLDESFGVAESASNDDFESLLLDAPMEPTVESTNTAPLDDLLANLFLPPAPAPHAAPVVEPRLRPKRPTPTYINLADIIRDDVAETPRMTIGEPQQTGDHGGDFEHILQEFREGIEKTIPIDDADSHFDLGIAFREMGLIDDAISEFQIASRSAARRVESIEALGGCFMDRGEAAVARNLLLRALDDPTAVDGDDRLRGVLYLLGLASESLGARDDGLRYYQRVYAVDIRFRDVAARIQTLQQPA